MPSDDIIQKIKALRAKVNNAASTEAEVEAAARMVAKLMMQHDVSEDLLNDVTKPEATDVGTGSKMKNDIDFLMRYCWLPLQTFTETKSYTMTDRAGLKEFHFIGLPHDVEMAMYLYELITMSAKRAWFRYSAELFDSGEVERTKGRRVSFYVAFGQTIGGMLKQLQEEREAARAEWTSTGTAIVIRKQDLIKEHQKSTGLKLRKQRGRSEGQLHGHAIMAGQSAAAQVNLGRPFDKNRSTGSIK